MTAPLAVEAPLNDFMLMGQLLRYHNGGVSTATSKKLGLHLWYLSEELIGLAPFDSRISIESKKLMLAAMQEVAPDEPQNDPKWNLLHFYATRDWSSSAQLNFSSFEAS